MARTQVTCEVVWRVTVEQLDGSGQNVTSRESLGDFDSLRDADQCLADEGFTRSRWAAVGNDIGHTKLQAFRVC